MLPPPPPPPGPASASVPAHVPASSLAPALPILTPAQLAAAYAELPPHRPARNPVSVKFYSIFKYLY